ncbi:hypothetical protein [Collimonas humicola]|uniref:hypothetical protein n=1 Tax=Collimonas humicola TaxID=2825886 RepID=UPI001B8CE8FC|nr:hypothetical protein [Collimonas humicola]
MRKRSYVTRAAVAAILAGGLIGITQTGRKDLSAESRVKVISVSAPLDASDQTSPFVRGALEGDELHLTIRSWFYRSGELDTPYISEDIQKNGVLHIEVRHEFGFFGTKCEYLRQVKIAVPAVRWRSLSSIQVFNEDIGEMVGSPMPLGSEDALAALRAASRKKSVANDGKTMANAC